MEPALIAALVLVLLTAAGGWWLHRRHRELVGDGDESDGAPAAAPESDAPTPVLDRNALLGRSRAFDPSGWDDTPDGEPEESVESGPTPDVEDLPTYFDRDFLTRRQRKDDTTTAP